jgi:hypothetical protein
VENVRQPHTTFVVFVKSSNYNSKFFIGVCFFRDISDLSYIIALGRSDFRETYHDPVDLHIRLVVRLRNLSVYEG